MSPQFCHDDYVISFGWHKTRYLEGDVVIVNHPRYQTIIKRICQSKDGQTYLLSGDGEQSTLTEAMGLISHQQMVGKVRWHIARKSSGTTTKR